MQLSSLREYVKYRIGKVDTTEYNTAIDYAINTIMRNINLELNLDVLRQTYNLTVFAGTQQYSLASDILKMDTIWNNNSYDHELIRICPSDYKTYLSDVDNTTGTLWFYDIYDYNDTT